MITKIAIRVVALLGAAWSIGPACASTSQGTDSNTHWIECRTIADCPNAKSYACVGGHCESASGDSGTPSTGGQGAGAGGSGGAAHDSGRAGGAAGMSATGGRSAGTGGTRDAGRIDGAGADSGRCAPMDAHTGNLPCVSIVGYTWTGSDCAPVVCSCEGADCASVYGTEAECRNARATCGAPPSISTACEHNSDCSLVEMNCCACGEPRITDKLAINVASVPAWQGWICRYPIPCPPCVPSPGPFQAVCVAGQCQVQNLMQEKSCLNDQFCEVKPADCCACGQLTSRSEVVALGTGFTFPQCSASCPPCSGMTLPPDVNAACFIPGGYCVLI